MGNQLQARSHYLHASRLMIRAGMRGTQVHRRQQIAMALLRYSKSWNTKFAKNLIAKYEGE